MGQKGYSPEFRQRALDLLGSGRKVVDVARDLGISDQTIYNWRRQDRVDRGELEGTSALEVTEDSSCSLRRLSSRDVDYTICANLKLQPRLQPKQKRTQVVGGPRWTASRFMPGHTDVDGSGWTWDQQSQGAGIETRAAHQKYRLFGFERGLVV